MHLAEIQHFGRPIILFCIDVYGIVRTPRSVIVLVPQPLKVHRHARCAGCGNHQIPSELEVEFLQARVFGPGRIGQKSVIRCQCIPPGRVAKVQVNPVEE